MNTMIKSKEIILPLENGENVALTLNFSRLMNVRSKRKNVYDRYNKIMMNGPEDVFDNVLILYTAYLCGLENIEAAMSEQEFIENTPPYMQMVNEIVMDLTRPKKKKDSEKPSDGEPEKQDV